MKADLQMYCARWATLALVGLVYLSASQCAPPREVPSRTATVGVTVSLNIAASPTRRPPAPQRERAAPNQTQSAPTVMPVEATPGITITILYDNNEYDERLETAWGFSCLVEGLEKEILFDTGGDSAMLLRNMRKLGINPQDVDAIVISHIHYDHLGGLQGFLEENHQVTVYLPQYLPANTKNTVRESGAELIEVHEPIQICVGAYSTGELGDWIKEQSLVIETDKGLVVITGCAHPGVVNVVREAKRLLKDDVYLVLGGFHLCWMNSLQVRGIAEGVRKEGVAKVAPCHCSGDLARSAFGRAYGEDFILVGVGKRLEID